MRACFKVRFYITLGDKSRSIHGDRLIVCHENGDTRACGLSICSTTGASILQQVREQWWLRGDQNDRVCARRDNVGKAGTDEAVK